MKVLLCTVWHTGSNYVRDRLRKKRYNVLFQHCDEAIFNKIKNLNANKIVTTLRDPLLVGASWANQYEMRSPEYRYHWLILWAGWERLIAEHNPEVWCVEDFTGPKMRSAGDPKQMHMMLRDGHMAAYYQFMPKELIDFAQARVDKVRQKLALDELIRVDQELELI